MSNRLASTIRLDLTRIVVWGHSFGGCTLLDLAAYRCGHRNGASLNSGPMLDDDDDDYDDDGVSPGGNDATYTLRRTVDHAFAKHGAKAWTSTWSSSGVRITWSST
jgi:hypothetical protein